MHLGDVSFLSLSSLLVDQEIDAVQWVSQQLKMQ